MVITLQGTSIHLGNRKIMFKMPLGGGIQKVVALFDADPTIQSSFFLV